MLFFVERGDIRFFEIVNSEKKNTVNTIPLTTYKLLRKRNTNYFCDGVSLRQFRYENGRKKVKF